MGPRRLGREQPSRPRFDNRGNSSRMEKRSMHATFEEPEFQRSQEDMRLRENTREEMHMRESTREETHTRESARDRIKRENEQIRKRRDRSRSSPRHSRSKDKSSEKILDQRKHSRERPVRSFSKDTLERRRRSMERDDRNLERGNLSMDHLKERRHSPRSQSLEKRSRRVDNLNFEPPLEMETRDNFHHFSPPLVNVSFTEDMHSMNRFSPPVRSEFETHYKREERFGPTSVQNSVYMENEDVNLSRPSFSQRSVGQELYQESFSQPVTEVGYTPSPSGLNIQPGENPNTPLIPDFNPETSKLYAIEWVKLIDEAARKHDWKKDEKQYILASRLSGYARQWYLSIGVNCKTWSDLRQSFLKAFPSAMDFHAVLSKMMARVKDDNETMASYFHHKVALLNACDIIGRKAVSCLIAGLQNNKLKQQAKAQNFEDPDELYIFLRSTESEPITPNKTLQKSSEDAKKSAKAVNVRLCYHCNSSSHLKSQCPRIQLKKKYSNQIMYGALSSKPINPKYFADISINGIILQGYVDENSECTTIREENAKFLGLLVMKQFKVVKAFGGSALSSIGSVDVTLAIDRAIANIILFVVPNHLQQIPIVVGQNFTDLPHVVQMKDGDKVRFYQRMDNGKTNFDF